MADVPGTSQGDTLFGTADADNARSLGQTVPVVASFYQSIAVEVARRWDLDGDGFGEVMWRNTSTGANQAWRGANNATQIAMPSVPVVSGLCCRKWRPESVVSLGLATTCAPKVCIRLRRYGFWSYEILTM